MSKPSQLPELSSPPNADNATAAASPTANTTAPASGIASIAFGVPDRQDVVVLSLPAEGYSNRGEPCKLLLNTMQS
jgi:hypothetical protein